MISDSQNNISLKNNFCNYFIYENGETTSINYKDSLFQFYHVKLTQGWLYASKKTSPKTTIEVYLEIFDGFINTNPRVFIWEINKLGNKVKLYIDLLYKSDKTVRHY